MKKRKAVKQLKKMRKAGVRAWKKKKKKGEEDEPEPTKFLPVNVNAPSSMDVYGSIGREKRRSWNT